MDTERPLNNTGSNTRLLLFAVLILLLAVAIGHALGVPIPVLSISLEKTNGQDGGITKESRAEFVSESWYRGANGYVKAEADQRQLGAPLIVYFYTDWCSYCKQFDEEFLTSDTVRSVLTKVVKARLNPEDGMEEKAIAQRFGVRGYPAIFILRPGAVPPRQVYPFKPVGETWVPSSPAEFALACQAAAFER